MLVRQRPVPRRYDDEKDEEIERIKKHRGDKQQATYYTLPRNKGIALLICRFQHFAVKKYVKRMFMQTLYALGGYGTGLRRYWVQVLASLPTQAGLAFSRLGARAPRQVWQSLEA